MQQSMAMPTSSLVSTTTDIMGVIRTSTWKTYVDPQGRFRFEYPANLTIGDQGESNALGSYWNPVYGLTVGKHMVLTLIDTPQLKSYVEDYVAELNARSSGMDSSPCLTSVLVTNPLRVTTFRCDEYDAYVEGNGVGIWVDSFDDGTGNSVTNGILSSIEFPG